MKIQNRRLFLQSLAIGSLGLPLHYGIPQEKSDSKRFQIGIQEYTFNRLLRSGKLKHLDYPAFVKKELEIEHIEYWSRPFEGQHRDKKFVAELKKRTLAEGIQNKTLYPICKSQGICHGRSKKRKLLWRPLSMRVTIIPLGIH